MLNKNLVLILDFGSQVTQLIARRIREFGVYCEVKNFNISIEEIIKISPKAIKAQLLVEFGLCQHHFEFGDKVSNWFLFMYIVTLLHLNFVY